MDLPTLVKSSRQKLDPAAISPALASGPADSGTLLYWQETQEQDQWCWAAVTVSVSKFYDPASSWTQCSLVNAELNRDDCCWDGGSSGCNRPWTLEAPLSETNNLNWTDGSAAVFPDIAAEINNRRLLGCRIGWASGGGHFVVIHGFSDGPNGSWVSVADPFYGSSTYAYDVFCTNYRSNGEWTHSYFTQP